MEKLVFSSSYKGRDVTIKVTYNEQYEGYEMAVIENALAHKNAFFHPYYSSRDRTMRTPNVTKDLGYYQQKLDELGIFYPEDFQLLVKNS